MRRILLKFVSSLLFVSLLFLFTGCYSYTSEELDELKFEQYLRGMEAGNAETFENLYKSVQYKESLRNGVYSKKNNFGITLSHSSATSSWGSEIVEVQCELYFFDYTFKSLATNKNVYIGIYGMSYNDSGEVVVKEELCGNLDSYLISVSFENENTHSLPTEFAVYDNIEFIAVVISVNGSIYAFNHFI